MGLSEHVEKHMVPPTRSNATPRKAMFSCTLCCLSACATSHRLKTSGCFLVVPSPVQGTSHTILSKPPVGEAVGHRGMNCARCCVTTSAAARSPKLAVRFTNVWPRMESKSLATTRPPISSKSLVDAPGLCSISSSCVVLLPGAAHMSSTFSPGCTSTRHAGSIDATSCRISLPESVPRMSHSRTSACSLPALAARNSCLSMCSCQPRTTPSRRVPHPFASQAARYRSPSAR
mmetsp:Transcript_26/g.117  ORF Transcript_26/g.117 Transcript_26/m.117 type:complete len:232 (-) Transcript_26:329-1024(-)